MKNRFYLIVILVTLLFGAWTYLEHRVVQSLAQTYEELARLPIYTYVNDTNLVSPLLEKLRQIPDLDSLKHETGFQAAQELITAYDLPLDENMIADYRFPDLITITFPPSAKGIAAKTETMKLLNEHLPEENIDSQSAAYDRLLHSLEQQKTQRQGYTFLMGMIMFILLGRGLPLIFEQKQYQWQARKSRNVVDMMRLKKSRLKRTFLLMILPVALVTLGYYALGYFKLLESSNLWQFFAYMGLISVLSSLVHYFAFRKYEQDDILSQPLPAVQPADTPEEPNA
ncbi:MAG: hypothetical protein LHW64_01740 [Candidatus Cloacimonetes bacterium]|jgi:hypothetical protein|nr:hypothetical protein [Candidatus Cloacimonadota bacterium]MCB5286508.1 hypothetical protein [Candidatus Cloacimonadota bacterium]MCK9184310.1 hypothetical protein [Candidatus Cloacimonadota bacterium]MCK9584269.1 hypothetical protein [Candidatus Cloacimonadota bacterium]MDY0228830.1 hypothetical protein [Candidatus Cloacimonadaceae bacterium]